MMTETDFIENYGSRDEDEYARMERFHNDLLATLNHFHTDVHTGNYKINHIDHPLMQLMGWLDQKANE